MAMTLCGEATRGSSDGADDAGSGADGDVFGKNGGRTRSGDFESVGDGSMHCGDGSGSDEGVYHSRRGVAEGERVSSGDTEGGDAVRANLCTAATVVLVAVWRCSATGVA